MPEFKIRGGWYQKVKQKIGNDKEPRDYHCFSIVNYHDLPAEYFSSREGPCLLGIVDGLLRDIKDNFKQDADYQFIIKLGEPNTAHFKHKTGFKGGKIGDNNMILKNKEYFENTVQKIGFGDSENYFYESEKKQKKPTKNPNMNNNPTKAENKNDGGKIVLFCLPIVMLALFIFLIVKWQSKKKR